MIFLQSAPCAIRRDRETRLHLRTAFAPGPLAVRVVADLLCDDVDEDRGVDLETGQTRFDLREAHMTARPLPFIAALSPGQRAPSQTRHTVTLRLTTLAYNQDPTLSAFSFWSPNQRALWHAGVMFVKSSLDQRLIFQS